MYKPYFWKQTDERWATYKYKTVTIGDSGCGPTCIANVVSALVKEVTPKDVFKWICKNGYMHLTQGTYWNGITQGLKHYGVTKFKVSYSTADALKELKAGKWLIGVVGPSRWTRGGHYILVYGYNKDGTILVSDPASSSDYRQEEGTWKEFAKAESCMWIGIDPKDYPKVNVQLDSEKEDVVVTMYVSDAKANIYKGCSIEHGVADVLKRGTKLKLISYKDGWYKIASGTYKNCFVESNAMCKYPPHIKTYKTKYVMNVRAGYTTKARLIGQVAKGTKMKSAYKVGGWIYVPALKGWVCVEDKTTVYCSVVKTAKKKSNKEIAKEVIAGKWGNGSERKVKLTKAGYDYAAVQKEVNKLLK